jgi:hypothetical protein
MCVSDAAFALPELQVDSRLVQNSVPADSQALAADSADAASVDDDASAAADNDTQATSN